MRKNIYLLMLLASSFCYSQTNSQNYVKTTMYRDASLGYLITLDTTGTALPPIIPISDTIKRVSISYFDGLGRPQQKIDYQQSTSLRDIVTYYEFDGLGRQPKEYLPYVRNTSSLGHVPHPMNETINFHIDPVGSGIGNIFAEATGNPYSEKEFADSPVTEIHRIAAPGNSWVMNSGHEVKFENNYNIHQEVRFLSAVSAYDNNLEIYTTVLNSQTSYYSPGQLYKSVTFDENNPSGGVINTQEFKDKLGRIVLKRLGTEIGYHDTYYVYDQFGNLSFVIPPLVYTSGTITQTDIDNLCYQYLYDNENRLIEKKLPGKNWEYIVYDLQNRVVATGPALNPFGDSDVGWLITKYDGFDRIVYTGWYKINAFNSEARQEHKVQIYMSDQSEYRLYRYITTIDSVQLNYSNEVYPITDLLLLTINYYDDYLYINPPSIPSIIFQQNVINTTRSFLTGSWIRVLENPGEVKNEFSHYVYDVNGRMIRTYKTNYLGGYTYTDSKLDFLGKVLYTHTGHKRTDSDTELLIKDNYTYSLQDRLLRHKQQINNLQEQLIVKNTYDELGQLISKNVGGYDVSGDSGLQKVDYTYNVRGWLKGINDINDLSTDNDLFAFKINYNTYDQTGSNDIAPNLLYNGNISSTYWITSADNSIRKYNYSYDNLNRLLVANYLKPQVATSVDSYRESLSYDKNGNIQKLERTGDLDATNFAIVVDELTYDYDSNNRNQLLNVTDASNHPFGFSDPSTAYLGNDYTYDENGNLISDNNKNITQIVYNHLNLPTNIYFADHTQNINYIYNAVGEKVKKTVNYIVESGYVVDRIDYLDGIQYINEKLSIIPHAEGYVNVRNKYGLIFNYVFNYTDHLGNIRVSYSGNGNSEPMILEENHYYPFGLKHTKYNTDSYEFVLTENVNAYTTGIELIPPGASRTYKYKYNGKEYQDELGLNMYDYGARNYDPAIGRFMNIDPLAEKLYANTPYNYVSNNPVNFVDPDGRSGIGTLDEENKTITISSKMFFYGGGASKNQAKDTAANIQKLWNDAGGTMDIDGVSYSVKFSISGEYVSESDAEEMAGSNGDNAENNFVRVEDGSDLEFKSSFYDTPGNSGYFIGGELNKHSVDGHEYGHGLGWYEAGEADGGRHDANIQNGVPGIMSPRGTPVSDEYGYGGQPAGQRTVSPNRRNVLPSDITKLNIDSGALKNSGKVNVGTATNNIYNSNGTVKRH